MSSKIEKSKWVNKEIKTLPPYILCNILSFLPVQKFSPKEIKYLKSKSVDLALFRYFKKDFTRKKFMITQNITLSQILPGLNNRHFLKEPKKIIVDRGHIVGLVLKKIKQISLDPFFRSKSPKAFEKLQYLKISEIYKISGQKWNKMTSLTHVDLHDLFNFKDDFFKQPLPKLRTLKVSICENLFGRKWNGDFAANIRNIEFFYCQICDDIFVNFSFPKLESLSIGDGVNIQKCSQWKQLSSLSFLSIFQNSTITDEFFLTQKLDKLERLLLEDIRAITGRNWGNKTFKKLEEFKTINVPLKDECFELNYFPVLETLTIFGENEDLLGNNWNKMPKVDEFNVGDNFKGIDKVKNLFSNDCDISIF